MQRFQRALHRRMWGNVFRGIAALRLAVDSASLRDRGSPPAARAPPSFQATQLEFHQECREVHDRQSCQEAADIDPGEQR
jgi:hypothetical protein